MVYVDRHRPVCGVARRRKAGWGKGWGGGLLTVVECCYIFEHTASKRSIGFETRF